MQDHYTLYRVLPWSRDFELCPEPTIEIPNQVFKQMGFRSKIAGFLVGTNIELLNDRLRSISHPIQPKCIIKRVFAQRSLSKLWFFIRVAIQLSLDRSPLGHDVYKILMLLFMYNLAVHAVNTHLPGFLLHSMSSKILRRFRKLGSSVPQWLHDPVLRTCISLSRALDERWQDVQRSPQSSLNWDPFLLDVAKDVQHSLPHTHDYVSGFLAESDDSPVHTPFLPNSRPRGTLNDFLSDPTWLYKRRDHDDAHVTLYDVERAVGEDIDNWVACVTDVAEACEQLECLAYQYYSLALGTYCRKRSEGDVDNLCIMLLTIIDIWVALDKLVIKEIPLLADYSPEIPVGLLCDLWLRDPICIQRFRRAYQYLIARHTQVHSGWSVFSDELTKHSFPCRYYDNSPHLQSLMVGIKDALPLNPVYAKVVVFEVECPVPFNKWQSLTYWISGIEGVRAKKNKKDILVFHIPGLQHHTQAMRDRSFSLYSSPAPQYWDRLYYVCEGSHLDRSQHAAYKLPSGPYADSKLQQYLDSTTHTHNQILVAQANCHSSLSLHEFIAFAHLRTGGSLQWFNILRELRSRTLDFRRQDVYLLFAQTSSQVGPLESTGKLSWHQELQDSSFRHALLDELESLFIDIGFGLLDGPGMATISLLAGVLVKRHCRDDVLGRAIQLLRDVRRKTFRWVHELLYEARKSPTDKESLKLLRDMAAVCRSTFDVGSTTSRKLLSSAQDIEVALSCSTLIRTNLDVFLGMYDPQTDSATMLTLSCQMSLRTREYYWIETADSPLFSRGT